MICIITDQLINVCFLSKPSIKKGSKKLFVEAKNFYGSSCTLGIFGVSKFIVCFLPATLLGIFQYWILCLS